MNILGALLFLAGVVCAGLVYVDRAPVALQNIGLSAPMWMGVSLLGVVLLWFNRRAAD
jgi:hypothetical protein